MDCILLTRATKDSDQLGRAAAIVADRNNIADVDSFVGDYLTKDVHQAIGSAAPGEYDDSLFFCRLIAPRNQGCISALSAGGAIIAGIDTVRGGPASEGSGRPGWHFLIEFPAF
jgi:hypothetical protein